MKGRSLLLLSGLLLALACQAAEAPKLMKIVLEFKPDPVNGRKVFDVCARCHMPEAWGNEDGTYPQLAGQHATVLLRQLMDIRSGRRANAMMRPFVQERTLGGYQNLVDVVAYIATLPMNPAYTKGPWPEGSPEFAQGKKIYLARCAACHGPKGEGDGHKAIPRLQGQHYPYTLRQALAIKRGQRRADLAMQAVVSQVGEHDLELALDYVSHLPVPKADLAPTPNWRNPDFK
jgi:cytochrome c553